MSFSVLFSRSIFSCFSIGALFVFLCACTPRVKLLDNNQNMYLSGRWNATDSRQTGQAISDQVLSEKWLPVFEASHGNKKPVVICGTIQNKSHEHIDAETFRKDIERAMINSGKIRIVQDANTRTETRGERADQQQFASAATQKKLTDETGADFILQGSINSIVDENKKKRVVYYQINLTLTNIESNEVVWIGEKKITKLVDY